MGGGGRICERGCPWDAGVWDFLLGMRGWQGMSPGVMGPLGIFLVSVPAGRVFGDILADATKRGFVADDVFVIVALPDGGAWGAPQFIDPACGEGFELADDFRQAMRQSGRGRRDRFGTCPYGTGTRGGTGGRCCCSLRPLPARKNRLKFVW
jgi:hypothetical protein